MSQHEWIDDQARFEAVVNELLSAERYALDTEFHRERTYFPQLALLQIAWADGLVLVDPFAVDLAPFAEVLRGDALAILHAADQDLEVLDQACGATPRRLFDTQLAAGFLGMSSPSLLTLVEKLLGFRLPKGDRLTDWTRRPLTDEQQSYAASDVLHLIELYERISAGLEERGRLAWAEEECELLLRRARGPQDPAIAWWRIKESRQLRGKARGVAQELAAWRERRAAELDVPPRFVLPDMAVAGIAHRPPRSLSELGGVRGLDGRHVKGELGQEIMDAVNRGQALSGSDVRLPATDDLDRHLRPAVTLVSAWIGQLSSELDIDATLLGTRGDLHSFLRGDEDAKLATGWRDELVGTPVRHLVGGHAALAFDGRGGLVLEARSYTPVDSSKAPEAGTAPS
ncbi:MAG TPA: HRDC domain-containing protein [Acidimicrobiales bacterium]|nr:HRDC domain-containing protein [Acidimicrobiales bacterium]